MNYLYLVKKQLPQPCKRTLWKGSCSSARLRALTGSAFCTHTRIKPARSAAYGSDMHRTGIQACITNKSIFLAISTSDRTTLRRKCSIHRDLPLEINRTVSTQGQTREQITCRRCQAESGGRSHEQVHQKKCLDIRGPSSQRATQERASDSLGRFVFRFFQRRPSSRLFIPL